MVNERSARNSHRRPACTLLLGGARTRLDGATGHSITRFTMLSRALSLSCAVTAIALATVACSSGDSTPTGGPSGPSAPEDSATTDGFATDAGATDAWPTSDTAATDGAARDATDDGGPAPGTSGCGKKPRHTSGGVTVTIDAGAAGDGERRFYLSMPKNYDPLVRHRLIFGYAGTNWTGEKIQPYLQLEGAAVDRRDDEIFVYPDPLWRDFEGWGNLGGWVLGPYAKPAHGDQDLVFTRAIVDYMSTNYCIDSERVFATGHSWGGDMAMVAGCFLGDVFRATVPVAANRPYWFETSPGAFTHCKGNSAVWVMFGRGDDHFTWQTRPGEFGDQCRDFWLAEHKCEGASSLADLGIGAAGECVEYKGCGAPTRYCLYDTKYRHQIPSGYFAKETMAFFRSF
jgi:polyhydroxybutyrate depolymerase